MMTIFWLVLVMGYGFFTWAAGNFSKAALSFLDGGYLAFLSFAVLPWAMGTEHFFPAVFAASMGVLSGECLEEKWKLSAVVFAIITGCYFFSGEAYSLGKILFLAFAGGMGLYHASAGIIPDQIEMGKALLSGAGFLVGTFLFICI